MKISKVIFILIFFALGFQSCKSIEKRKKVKTESISTLNKQLDTSLQKADSKLTIGEKTLEETTTDIIQTYDVKVINGKEVLVPVVKTITVTKKDGSKDRVELKSEILEDIDSSIQADNSIIKNSDVDKKSKGIEIISEIISGLLGGFLGNTVKTIIGFILMLILVPIVIGVIRKLKKKDKIK